MRADIGSNIIFGWKRRLRRQAWDDGRVLRL